MRWPPRLASAHREAVEEHTDQLAVAPLTAIGADGCLQLRELVRPWSIAIAADIYPRPRD